MLIKLSTCLSDHLCLSLIDCSSTYAVYNFLKLCATDNNNNSRWMYLFFLHSGTASLENLLNIQQKSLSPLIASYHPPAPTVPCPPPKGCCWCSFLSVFWFWCTKGEAVVICSVSCRKKNAAYNTDVLNIFSSLHKDNFFSSSLFSIFKNSGIAQI